MRKIFLLSILIIYLSAFSAYSATLNSECNNEDQTQDLYDYGFWFEKNVVRGQEFIPTYNTLNQIELYLDIRGEAGDVIVEILDQEENILSTSTIEEENLTDGWTVISFDQAISVNTNSKYTINVYSSEESLEPTNRYFWRGSNSSTYSGVNNSVIDSWNDFDFAFKTFGCNQTLASNTSYTNEMHSNLSLYPNPTKSSLNIKLINNSAITQGTVINSTGQTVKKIILHKSMTQINIEDLDNGIYFIRIVTENEILLKKFIKEN